MSVRLNFKYFSSLRFQLTPSYPDCITELKCSIQIFDLAQVKLSQILVTSIAFIVSFVKIKKAHFNLCRIMYCIYVVDFIRKLWAKNSVNGFFPYACAKKCK